jgi:hypothetical protein
VTKFGIEGNIVSIMIFTLKLPINKGNGDQDVSYLTESEDNNTDRWHMAQSVLTGTRVSKLFQKLLRESIKMNFFKKSTKISVYICKKMYTF